LSTLTFFLVIFLQQLAGYSALKSGFALVPITVVMFVLSPRVGRMSMRYGPRLFMGVGPLIAAAGLVPLIWLKPDFDYWFELLPPARLQPDTRHRFRIDPARSHCATHVRLEIHPDGGMARLRLFGELTGDGRAQLGLAWFDRLPGDHALAVLAADCGLAGPPAAQLAAGRPYRWPGRLDALLSGGELPGLDATAARRVRALVLG